MNKKSWTITAFVILSLIVCAFLVTSGNSYVGTRAYPDGETKYVNDSSFINISADLVFSDLNVYLNYSSGNEYKNISNLTLWTDLGGTWALNRTNNTAVNNQSFSWIMNITGIYSDATVIWNIRATNHTNAQSWVFSANKSFMLDYIQIYEVEISSSNESIYTTSTPTINVTILSSDTPLQCCLFLNKSSEATTGQKECKSDVVNQTAKTFGGIGSSWELPSKGEYRLLFNCSKANIGLISNSSNAVTIKYIPDAPSVIVNNPSSGLWSSTGAVNFSITPSDEFISTCELWLDGLNNGSFVMNVSDTSLVNGSQTNFSLGVINLADTNASGIKWGYRCNNSAGYMLANNFTLYIDTNGIAPIALSTPSNDTRSTDYRPTLTWKATTDIAFANYTIHLMNSSLAEVYTYYITSNSTTSYEVTNNLTADSQWYWNITVWSRTGVGNVSSNATMFNYYPDSVGHQLYSGYNFFSIVRSDYVPASASKLCAEPSTTPTSVSRWHSNHTWQTFVCGTSTSNFTLNKYDAVVFNMPSDGVWENGRVWDLMNSTVLYINISNSTSGTPWALVGVSKDTTLTKINGGNVNLTDARAFTANETTTSTVWGNITYSLARSKVVLLGIYNGSNLVPSADYTFNGILGSFMLGVNSTSSNHTASNLTISYAFYDRWAINFMSYPNHTQTNMPYKTNWSFNGATNLYDGDAVWLHLNTSSATSLQINRTKW